MYSKSNSKVYFIGVSEENEVKVLARSESSGKSTILKQNLINLKGVRNVLVVRSKHLLVETASQLVRYDVWDLIDTYVDPTLREQRQPEAEIILESRYKDYSCLEASMWVFSGPEHQNPFVYTYD